MRWDEVKSLHDLVAAFPPAGAFTHFHSAELGNATMEEQMKRFEEALAMLPVRPAAIHAENSAAIERCGKSRWTFARPGYVGREAHCFLKKEIKPPRRKAGFISGVVR